MPALADAFARLSRAGEHISEIAALADEICQAQSEATNIEAYPGQVIQPGDFAQVLSVESANTPIAGKLAVLVGDAVNSLRSALDYLVKELSTLDSGSRSARTQFPVEQTEAAFRSRQGSFLKGLNAVHVAQIQTLQPYSGTVWTSKLAVLSNWDKHNQLVLVAHDYMVGGVVHQFKTAEGELRFDVKLTVTPSLRIELQGGMQLVEVLAEVRAGVSAVLQQFAPEFDEDGV